MEISGAKLIFLFGCLGGFALELLRWWKLRESIDWPVYSRKPTYWLLTIAMIAMGGLIAVAYGTKTTSAILAMNVGAAAPAIIGALATPPSKDGPDQKSLDGSERAPRRLRRFLAFG